MNTLLVPNWGTVLKKSWSLRFIYLGMIATVLEGLLTTAGIDWIPADGWLKILITVGILGLAAYYRLVPQPELHPQSDDTVQES
jgi:hypothetical protein